MCLLFLRYLHNSLLNMLHIPIATKEDLLTNLPQEMMIDILLRLPPHTISRCKCVCKSWRDLIKGSEFVTSHLSKSRSGLVVVNDVESSKPYKICAFNDGRRPRLVADFGFPHNDDAIPTFFRRKFIKIIPHSSANGLLLLMGKWTFSNNVFICNPITREYIEVPPPPRRSGIRTYGFGASKISGQYKVVMIFSRYDEQPICEVYSVGRGLWRSCSIINNSKYDGAAGVFFNGNLHWMAYDCKSYRFDNPRITCFDLETELFTFFAPPLSPVPRDYPNISGVCALGDRLCLCDTPHNSDTIVIWSMNKYGDEKSWGKAYIIKTPPPPSPIGECRSYVIPLTLFKEGEGEGEGDDILFKDKYSDKLFFYSNKTKTIREYRLSQLCLPQLCSYYSTNIVLYTASFLSLKTMGIQNVASF